MGFLSNLFGGKRKQAIMDALINGAKIIDVRTPSEYKADHIEGAINIPVDQLHAKAINKIKKMNAPVVVYCATGSRSAGAKGILQRAGIETVNGGSIHTVYNVIMSD